MLERGEDLVNHMTQFGFGTDDLDWIVPRSAKRNSDFKLRGISIAGKLTHQLVGHALSKDSNVLLVSDCLDQTTHELLKEYGEVLYQEGIFVLSWNRNWLVKSQEGRAIIAKIFHSNYQEIYHEHKLVQIQYQQQSKLTSILDRFSNYIVIQSGNNNLNEIQTKEIWFLFDLNREIEHLLKKKHNIIIISFVVPKNSGRFVTHNKHRYLIIDRTAWFNEISREMYYYIKQKSYLNMDFLPNMEVRFDVRK